MILSEKKKYLFVHIPKCAGESITKFLLEDGGDEFLNKHDKLKKAITKLSDSYQNYYSFSVIRNPFDQVVSFYEHLRKPLYIDHKKLKKQYPNFDGLLFPKRACKIAINFDFKSYVKAVYLNNEAQDTFSFWFDDQVSFLTNFQDKIDINYIIRFENLVEELNTLKKRLNLTGELNKTNKSRNRNYSEYYDYETQNIIATKFKETIDTFGYKFMNNAVNIYQSKLENNLNTSSIENTKLSQSQETNQEQLWQQITSHLNNKQLKKAEYFLDQYLTIDPTNFNALREYALLARKLNLKEAALDRWERILKLYPQEDEIIFESSQDLIELKLYEQAEQRLKHVLENHPNHLGAILWFGVLEQKRGRHKVALQYFHKAREKYPEHPNAYVDAGISLRELRRYKEAEDCFKKALEINPKSEWVLTNLVHNLYLLGGVKALFNRYNTYNKEFPDNNNISLFWARKILEHPYVNSHDLQRVKLYLQNINQNSIEYFDALLELAQIELKLKNHQDALSYIDQAQKINSKSADVYSIFGMILLAMGDIQKGQQAFTKAFSLPNLSPSSLMNYLKANCNDQVVQEIQEESRHNVIITKPNKFYQSQSNSSLELSSSKITNPIDVFLKINRNDETAYYCLEFWIKVFSLNPKYNIKILADIPLNKKFDFPILKSKEGMDAKYKELFNQTRGTKWRFATTAFLSCYEYAETNFYWNIDADDTYYELSPKILLKYLVKAENIAVEQKIDCFSQDFYRSTTISNSREAYDHWSFGICFHNQNIVEKLKQLTSDDFRLRPPWIHNLDFLFEYLNSQEIINCESWYIPNTVFYHTKPVGNLQDGIYSYGLKDVNKFPINPLVKQLSLEATTNSIGNGLSSLADSLNSGALVVEHNNETKSFCLLISRLEPQFYEFEFKFIEGLFGKLKFKVGFKKIEIEECIWESVNDCQDIKIYAKQDFSPVNVLNNYWDILIKIPVKIPKRSQFYYLLKCARNARRVLFTSHNDLIDKEFSLIAKKTSSS